MGDGGEVSRDQIMAGTPIQKARPACPDSESVKRQLGVKKDHTGRGFCSGRTLEQMLAKSEQGLHPFSTNMYKYLPRLGASSCSLESHSLVKIVI